jgi:hypothetical protein
MGIENNFSRFDGGFISIKVEEEQLELFPRGTPLGPEPELPL